MCRPSVRKPQTSAHSAVQLFIATTRAAQSDFSPHGDDLATIAAICRRLDGIPLAIDFAATRVASLGLHQVAAGLDDRLQMLTSGRRTALPRHQTLRATLDWSYDLLPEPERLVMRRLAIFAGDFTAEAASLVAAGGEIAASEVVRSLASLVTKSLVALDVVSVITHYRLHETTRAYALEKLSESGELGDVARRHADYYRDLLERAEAEPETLPAPASLTPTVIARRPTWPNRLPTRSSGAPVRRRSPLTSPTTCDRAIRTSSTKLGHSEFRVETSRVGSAGGQAAG